MQSFKMRLTRICKTMFVMDLRKDVHAERLQEIATKARRFESRNKTKGKRSVFKIED